MAPLVSSSSSATGREDLGLHSSLAKQLSEEIDIVVNGAAITNFYERYAHMHGGIA